MGWWRRLCWWKRGGGGLASPEVLERAERLKADAERLLEEDPEDEGLRLVVEKVRKIHALAYDERRRREAVLLPGEDRR